MSCRKGSLFYNLCEKVESGATDCQLRMHYSWCPHFESLLAKAKKEIKNAHIRCLDRDRKNKTGDKIST